MKIIWGIWFFVVGLIISIPVQVVGVAMWHLVKRGGLECNFIDSSSACSPVEFLGDAAFWAFLYNLGSFGLPTLLISVCFAVWAVHAMRKGAVMKPL